jgi:dienelactone hydrolase family protein
MANTLSKEGYAAVDLFRGQVAVTSEQARQLAGFVRSNPASAIANLQSAVEYVSSLPFVDSSKVASIGWCFGGGQSLQLAFQSDLFFDLIQSSMSDLLSIICFFNIKLFLYILHDYLNYIKLIILNKTKHYNNCKLTKRQYLSYFYIL